MSSKSASPDSKTLKEGRKGKGKGKGRGRDLKSSQMENKIQNSRLLNKSSKNFRYDLLGVLK